MKLAFYFMYTVYILYSESLNRYYTGFTGDSIEIRLKKHLSNHKGFTGKRSDWVIVYQEKYAEKKAALSREKAIKNWKNRKLIENLIRSTQ